MSLVHRFLKVVKGLAYMQSQADLTLFIKHSRKGKMTVLIVYVSVIIVTGNNIQQMNLIKGMLARELEVKDLGSLKFFWRWNFLESDKEWLYPK